MKERKPIAPPRLAVKLFEWYCDQAQVEDLQGDLDESFDHDLRNLSATRAKYNYWKRTFSLLFSYTVKQRKEKSSYSGYSSTTINMDMIINYIKIAFRNMRKNKAYSLINMGGLSAGLTTALFIGLWITDEVTFDQYHPYYEKVAQVMQHKTFDGHRRTEMSLPIPLGAELKEKYGSDFKHISMASWMFDHILSHGEKNLMKTGIYMEESGPQILGLTMIKGARNGLKETHSIFISESTARALFGESDPMNQVVRIDNKMEATVTGVFQDLPSNAHFTDLNFISPWELYVNSENWVKRARDENQWGNNSFQIFVQVADHAKVSEVSEKIKQAKYNKVPEEDKNYQSEIFLHPVKDWHLRNHWEEGVQQGGQIQRVWLFGAVGAFVLVLASINFMNLSTARAEKRAREVGVRKAIGSRRKQLVIQFFSESFLMVIVSFCIAISLVALLLPQFNFLTQKNIEAPFLQPLFWMVAAFFIIIVGVLSGSYPAFYLSSFNSISVLKGTFRLGSGAHLPRKMLVIFQYTVSVTLIIATLVVYQQLEYSRNRPIGYNKDGIVMIQMQTPDYYGKYNILQNELKNSGAAVEMAESSSPLTEVWATNGGMHWEGKDPSNQGEFATIFVTHDFGKTIGWQIREGRDFSRDFASDSASIILNEAAVKYMGIKNPIGKIVHWGDQVRGRDYQIIGIVKDILIESPFKSVYQAMYLMDYGNVNWIDIKLNPALSMTESVSRVESIFRKHFPTVPFTCKFADQEFASKFSSEEQIGKLSLLFSSLAILISCLGLFGLASFVAQQRMKEISIRKVLGATVFHVWKLLSKDFLMLVFVSIMISIPLGYYFMTGWLKQYEYRITLGSSIFLAAGATALTITLFTISYQCLKTALSNPVESLKSE